MPKKKKESVNYLDQIPRISVPKWEVLEDGLVEVTVENKGFFNVIAQKCFHRPRTSYIKLDEYGSCVFQQIDGRRASMRSDRSWNRPWRGFQSAI